VEAQAPGALAQQTLLGPARVPAGAQFLGLRVASPTTHFDESLLQHLSLWERGKHKTHYRRGN
jgi:hypothetical protein